MPDGKVDLNHTVRFRGKDVRVNITYERDGTYFVFTAPLYNVRVSKTSRVAAWKEFSEKVAFAVENSLISKL